MTKFDRLNLLCYKMNCWTISRGLFRHDSSDSACFLGQDVCFPIEMGEEYAYRVVFRVMLVGKIQLILQR